MEYISYITVLNFYNFFLEMMIINLILTKGCIRKKHYWVKLIGFFAFSFLLYFCDFNYYYGFNPSFLIVYILIAFYDYLLYEISFVSLISFASASFALQHISWNITAIIIESLDSYTQLGCIAIYIICFTCVYLLIYLIIKKSQIENMGEQFNNLSSCVAAFFIIAITYVLSSLVAYDPGWNVYFRIYAIICCAIALGFLFDTVQIGFLNNTNKELVKDKAILEQLMNQQKHYQKLSEETIDIINLKCHDMKNQISALRTMDLRERADNISKIEKAINVYGEIAKTGNSTFDVVLTEKGLLCESNKIHFTYLVDPDAISFLGKVEIATLFGNALDNAIESERKIEIGKRYIHLDAKRKNNIVAIHMENYYEGDLILSSSLPETNKSNKIYHGYGLKSIQYIVDKYEGNMQLKVENHMFNLNIVITVKI